MSKYFGTPFAESGTKTAIPDAAQAGGEVSYAEGYTNDYTLDQTSNPSAKDIEIDKFNQLGHDLSGAIKEIQEQGIPLYRADVNHSVNSRKVGSDGEVYKCLIANGPLTTVVDPVGDVTGTWEEVSPQREREWVTYTPSQRALSTTYFAPDDRDIHVAIYCSTSAGSAGFLVDGALIYIVPSNTFNTISVPVGAGSSYILSDASTLLGWREFR